METDTPYNWLRKIDNAILALDEIPLFGKPEPFDWKKFSQLLAEKFDLDTFEITPKNMEWKKFEEKPGQNLISIPFSLTPLSGDVFWVMSQRDIAKLTSWMLTKTSKQKTFSSEILQEGFYRYLTLEALDSLENTNFLEGFSPKMVSNIPPFSRGGFCIDIEINLDHKSCFGTLILTPEFRKGWKRHFETAGPSISPELASSLELTLGAKAGEVLLDIDTWENLEVGDFILLDHTTYNPITHKGSVSLMLGKTPLFQVKIKEDKMKLLDYALYYEEQEMTENIPNKEELEKIPEEPAAAAAAEEEVFVEKVAPVKKESTLPIKEIPIPLTVEVARIKMTLEKLSKLKPGNFLELPVHPDAGVTLTVHGKKVGRAELVNLGESLGIRILELGK